MPYFALGFAALLSQVIVLREILSVFSGNELVIGITISFWLIFAGTGSIMGWRIKGKAPFGVSFLAAALLIQPTLLAIRNIRPALSIGPAEAVSLGLTAASTAVVLLPLCTTFGVQFPLAVRKRGGRAGSVYALEAMGAFAGGVLFTLFIAGKMGSAAIATLLSLLLIAVASYVLGRKSVISFFILPLIFYFALMRTVESPFEGMDVVSKKESRYGEILVLEQKGQLNVYQSGGFVFSYPEPQTEEQRAHVPMSVLPGARSVLVIGGSPGTLREFLKHPIKRLVFVETDPAMADLSVGFLHKRERGVLGDKRLRVFIKDGRAFLKSPEEERGLFDLILVNVPPPSTANINRFYTREFFKEAAGALGGGGVIALGLHGAPGYTGRSMRLANGSIYGSLRSVFRHVEVSSEEYGALFASNSPFDAQAQTLTANFTGSGVMTEHFGPYILDDAFSPLKASYAKERLEGKGLINTDLRPAAYLYNLFLWAETHGGGAIKYAFGLPVAFWALSATVIVVASGVFIFGRKKRAVYYSMFSTGAASMALCLSIILGYQASFGYVYEMIGLISAVFMAGVPLGAYASGRLRVGPIAGLMLFEAVTVALLFSAPLFFRHEVLFYVLSLSAGFLTGALFVLSNISIGRAGEGKTAGGLYGFDLFGSFAGAFSSSVVLIPVYGVSGSLYFIIFLKVFSLLMLFSVIRHEKS